MCEVHMRKRSLYIGKVLGKLFHADDLPVTLHIHRNLFSSKGWVHSERWTVGFPQLLNI